MRLFTRLSFNGRSSRIVTDRLPIHLLSSGPSATIYTVPLCKPSYQCHVSGALISSPVTASALQVPEKILSPSSTLAAFPTPPTVTAQLAAGTMCMHRITKRDRFFVFRQHNARSAFWRLRYRLSSYPFGFGLQMLGLVRQPVFPAGSTHQGGVVALNGLLTYVSALWPSVVLLVLSTALLGSSLSSPERCHTETDDSF